jgi:histone acetyltransferase (RNA polymerase elongator complex component)
MLQGDGVCSKDIRAREIGRNPSYYNKAGAYNCYKYRGNSGDDYFIAYESVDQKALFGFIRLRIVDQKNNKIIFDILRGRGLIRELHVYGDTVAVNSIAKSGCQHSGIGSGLLNYAETVAMENGLCGIVVISGEGVKAYYEKKGYKEVDTFMVKDFWTIYVMFYYYKRVILDTSYSYYNRLVMTMLILYYSVHLCFMAFVYVLFAGLLIVFAHILY